MRERPTGAARGGLLRRAPSALLPLALTPLWLHLIASGRLDLGGGEKDLVWLVPWTVWSLVFAVGSLVLGHRGWPLGRASLRSALVGLAALVLGAAILGLFGELGVGGVL